LVSEVLYTKVKELVY